MDATSLPPDDGPPPSEKEMAIDVMLQVLMIQARTTVMLLGQAPHPSTGERITDLPRAKILIDQLETAAAQVDKLSLDENQMLKDTVHQLRLAYVEKASSSGNETPPDEIKPNEPKPEAPTVEAAHPPTESGTPEGDEPARKRFVKKYD